MPLLPISPDMMTYLPTFFLSHGGGPWPYMDGPFRRQFDTLEQSIKDIPRQAGGLPKAILMVSGHWESDEFMVSSSPNPPMLYDYYGFPEHTYHVHYRAPGSPELAARVMDLLKAGGMKAHADAERGFDHGTFSLMEPMRPEADIPVVQMSIRQSFDPAEHIAAGRLLAPLCEEGVLIIGSGLS